MAAESETAKKFREDKEKEFPGKIVFILKDVMLSGKPRRRLLQFRIESEGQIIEQGIMTVDDIDEDADIDFRWKEIV